LFFYDWLVLWLKDCSLVLLSGSFSPSLTEKFRLLFLLVVRHGRCPFAFLIVAMVHTITGIKVLLFLGAVLEAVAAGPVFLSPVQDIFLPASESATSPLTSLGANSPWFAGWF
jgi:hypothetical protein